MPSDEKDRITSLLKNAIRLSNHTYRDVERELGWRVGTITRPMRGGLGLKGEHLLTIARWTGFSPGRFFAAACPIAAGTGPAEDRLFRLLEQMYADPSTLHAPPPAASPQDEIDEMVQTSLRKLLGSGALAAGAAGSQEPQT